MPRHPTPRRSPRGRARGEQRADVRRDEPRERERPRAPAELGLAPDRVAVVLFPEDAALRRWLDKAGEKVHFEGLPARICWLGYKERHLAGLRFNENAVFSSAFNSGQSAIASEPSAIASVSR
jgi:hypothetical protein